LLFVPFLLIWFLKLKIQNSKFKILRKYLFLCLIILLTISPATIRNYLVSGKFVLISTNGPVSLWIGNNPYAEGVFYYPPPIYGNKVAKMVKTEGEKAYVKEVLKFTKERPMEFLGLQLRKFLLFWDRYEIENNVNYGSQRGCSSLFSLPIFIGFGLIGPLSLFGILLSLKNWRKALLLYLFIFTFMISTIIFFITARYRISTIPLFILFSGSALFWLFEKIGTKNYRILSFSLIPLFLSFLLGYSQDISKRAYPLIYPEGLHIWQPEGMFIRDTTSTQHKGDSFTMNSSNDAIKKELIITENLSEYKKAMFWLIASIGKNPGALSIQINDKEVLVSFAYSRGLLDRYPIEFKIDWLKKGVNTIILKPVEMAEVSPAIDNFYTFGRSYLLKDGQWEGLKKGEYMIWLQLLRE
jgi:hypothetical protein